MDKLTQMRKWLLLGMGGAFLITLGVLAASAVSSMVTAHGGASGKIHACVNSSIGLVLLVPPNNDCSALPAAWRNPIDWDIEGGGEDWAGIGTGSIFPADLTNNVGIGTANPQKKLHVGSDLDTVTGLGASGDGVRIDGVLELTESGVPPDPSESSVYLYTDADSCLRVRFHTGNDISLGCPEPPEVIRFHDGQWDSLWLNNAVAMYIIEHGYGYPVESVVGNRTSIRQGLPAGDLDVNMEMWRVNDKDWVEEQIALGTIIDLGQIYEQATQGWYVPTYMIEGDPDRGIEATAPELKTVFDLVQYKDLFKDPEDSSKGLLVNCIIGWRCQQINRIKLNTYTIQDDSALSDHFNVIEPGAAAGIDAAIRGAHEAGEPVLSYYWEPTWLLGTYDMTLLEEPPNTEQCDAAIAEARENYHDDNVATEACGYENTDIHNFISSMLLQKAPEVVPFLNSMFMGTQRLQELMAYMDQNGLTPDETAVYFLQNFEWCGWVSQDICDKVKATLP